MVNEMRRTFIGSLTLNFQISYKLMILSASHLCPIFLRGYNKNVLTKTMEFYNYAKDSAKYLLTGSATPLCAANHNY